MKSGKSTLTHITQDAKPEKDVEQWGLRRSLREYLYGKTDESKRDAGEDGREEENGGV